MQNDIKSLQSASFEIFWSSVDTKGQLISKCPFGIFKSTKKTTNLFKKFQP